MAPYLIRCLFYQKMSRYNVFQYKIPNRMSYIKTLYNHFENFGKIKFQWGNFRKTPGLLQVFIRFSI